MLQSQSMPLAQVTVLPLQSSNKLRRSDCKFAATVILFSNLPSTILPYPYDHTSSPSPPCKKINLEFGSLERWTGLFWSAATSLRALAVASDSALFNRWRISTLERLFSSSACVNLARGGRIRDGILERYFKAFLSGFLPSFFSSTKCYSWINSSFLISRILL